jgi:hypothetical protein
MDCRMESSSATADDMVKGLDISFPYKVEVKDTGKRLGLD